MRTGSPKNAAGRDDRESPSSRRFPFPALFSVHALTFFFCVSIILLSLVPPVSKDALVHHLTLPKLYLKNGGMYEIPSMIFSYFPMNLDLLYLIPLYWGCDIAPKFIHSAFAAATAFLMYLYLNRRTGRIWAATGVLFFLSIPVIVKLSISAYVDLGLIFFSSASIFLIFRWIESDFHLKYLVLSALSCGLAMGTKYNGLILFALLTAFIPFAFSRFSRTGKSAALKAAGFGIAYCLIALLIFSPWMIRNYIWKKNPIYPLYDSYFQKFKNEPAYAPSVQRKSGVFMYRNIVFNESWLQMTLLPVRIFFQGKDGSDQYFDGKLTPLLFFLPFFAFFGNRESLHLKREKRFLLVFIILFFMFAMFSSVLRIRYISPIIPPLVILSVLGFRNIAAFFSAKNGTVYGIIVSLIVILYLLPNIHYLIQQYRYVAPFHYITGRQTRDQYIAAYRPEYPVMQYINASLPENSLILFLFMGKRGYYCDREYVFDLSSSGSTIENLIQKSDSHENMAAGLQKQGITHLLVHIGILERWIRDHFQPEEQTEIRLFFNKYARLLKTNNHYRLFEIVQQEQQRNRG